MSDTSLLKSGFDDDAESVKKRKRRGRCARCCCWTSIVVTGLFLALLIVIAVIELTSRPGYARASQDTHSQDTMVKIQGARESNRNLVARMTQTGFDISRSRDPRSVVTRADLVAHLQRATAFSSAAYTAVPGKTESCPRPVGSTMLRVLSDNVPGVGGFIAVDDNARQLVVAMRGAGGLRDFSLQTQTAHERLDIAGAVAGRGAVPADAMVQRGYHRGAQAVQREVVDTVQTEIRARRDFSVLVTGHGLGGSVAVLLGLSLRDALPLSTPVFVVTQGQPRTGNTAFANYVDRVFPPSSGRLFRVVHHLDAVPTLAGGNFMTNPASRHHCCEVWQVEDAALADKVVFCRGQEDPECSTSRPGQIVQASPPALAVTAEHFHYLDIELGSPRSRQCGLRGGQILAALFTSRGELRDRPVQRAGVIAA